LNLFCSSFSLPWDSIIYTCGSDCLRALSSEDLTSQGSKSYHTNSVRCLSISASGDLLASGGADHAIYLYILPELKMEALLYKFNGNVNSLSFSPDNQSIIAAGE
jgi:WD40 repeat protein